VSFVDFATAATAAAGSEELKEVDEQKLRAERERARASAAPRAQGKRATKKGSLSEIAQPKR